MSRNEVTPIDARETARRAFRDAAGAGEPDVSRIVARVPEILAEARRRRAGSRRVDSFEALLPVARTAIPRLAALAAALLLVALFVGGREAEETYEAQTGLDRYILTGEVGDGAVDVLLEAIAEEGNADG